MTTILQKESLSRIVAIITMSVIVTIGSFRYFILSYPVPPIFRTSFTIPDGASATRVGMLMAQMNIVPNADLFINAVRLKFGTRSIQPGRYLLINARTIGDLAQQILEPDWRPIRIFVPEGATREQIAEYYAAKYPTNIDTFMALTEDQQFMRSLGIGSAPHMEGYLLPETYHVRNGITEAQIIEQMVDLTFAILGANVVQRGAILGLDPHGILTMASIVEGEAMLDEERETISAVYHNRLKKGMRLQADPTVQYALPDGPRRLLFRDYKYPSEYNTYLHKGLPPGPINNPGKASILAAVAPLEVEYLYFVATGDGGHTFTHTFDEHTQAIKRIRADQ